MASVHKKLMQARIRLHGMKISKSGRNEFAKYNYMELGDFLIPTQTIFAELGLCGLVSFAADIATLTITDTEDGSELVLTSPMAEAQLKGCHPIQNLGAVQSYLRRYLWVAALEIVEHDVIDSSPPVEKTTRAPIIPASPKIILSPEDEQFLSGMATDVVGMCIDLQSVQALQLIRAACLDSDQQIALNNMLDSKTRSALKKAKEITTTKEVA